MNEDKWGDIFRWEEKHKTAVFMTISVEDVRDWFDNECVDPDESPVKNLTDEELWEAVQHVSHKYEFCNEYENIYDWVLMRAENLATVQRGQKESENA